MDVLFTLYVITHSVIREREHDLIELVWQPKYHLYHCEQVHLPLNMHMDLLGHSSLASTSVYTHTTFEELKKVYHAHPRAKKEGGYYGR